MTKEQGQTFENIRIIGTHMSSLCAYIQNDFDYMIQDGYTKEQLISDSNSMVLEANKLMNQYADLIKQAQQIMLQKANYSI